MGIVLKQSFKNTISTYLGFGIGAINTLFLYTNFITDDYYGLVAFVLSTANIMMPIMAFGVHNTLIKFYSTYKTKATVNSFLTLMLFLPLLIIVPLGVMGYLAYDTIAGLLSHENAIIYDYVWHIFIVAVTLAYFEVFFAWAKVQMQTVFGNIMKEVFHRVGIMVLLFGVYFDYLTVTEFVDAVVVVYILRMIIMKLYAYVIRWPVLRFQRLPNVVAVLKYSSLIIIAGSIATLILDIDKFMIGQYVAIEEVAYYSVAIYIATVIAVPQRAMHQIISPLTAQFLNNKNTVALKDLYQRSSLTLFIIGGLIFLLIVLNINQLYLIIPKAFSDGLFVVFMIGLVKLYDCLLGNNNAILFNSDYYRMVLFFGVLLVGLIVVLNMVFIPWLGIDGAALATFVAIAVYNTIKVVFVYRKFKMLPMTSATYKVFGVLVVGVLLFYFWDFPFQPLLNIAFKSVLVGVCYLLAIYGLNVSSDINALLSKYLKH